MPLKKEQVPKFYQGIGMLARIRTRKRAKNTSSDSGTEDYRFLKYRLIIFRNSLEFRFCMHVSLRTCTCKHLSRMLGEVLYPQVVCPYRNGCSSN